MSRPAPTGPEHPSGPAARAVAGGRAVPPRAVRRAAHRRTAHGDHLGFGLGPGSEPADARVYQPGQDDVRRIDWNVTARTGEVHVRDLVADRELTTWALVDATASMDFGTALMEKRDLAAAVTIALAYVTNRGADQFGAHLLTAEGVLSWPRRSGRCTA